MKTMYVKDYKTSFKTNYGSYKTLLWGDPVHITKNLDSAGYYEIIARRVPGKIHKDFLTENNDLLEFYIIDVGQGDGVLFKTPDNKWHLYDGGVANEMQMTKKGAANFIRWKFIHDLKLNKIKLENLILSHPDFDHYGGLLNLLKGEVNNGTTKFNYKIKNFYHTGMARFQKSPELGKTAKGKVDKFPIDEKGIKRNGTFIYELYDDIDSIANSRAFKKGKTELGFFTLMDLIKKNIRNSMRISHLTEYLPGYGKRNNKIKIKVLGPILEEYKNNKFGLRYLGSAGKTRNGHSVVLRFDYGNAKILLTGDLNDKSQKLILSYISDEEFASDVVKGCHHGSEDVNMEFIKSMSSRSTVISSGDNEDYSHPRPVILGASAFFGREVKMLNIEDGRYNKLPPLLYSTELARSTKLAYMKKGKWFDKKTSKTKYINKEDTRIKAGSEDYKSMEHLPLAIDLIYGLINVRTDGKHILCATMEEKGSDFDVKVFKAGV